MSAETCIKDAEDASRVVDPHIKDAFRLALRGMASTVAVITSAHDDVLNGMTATAVVSVSMDPPSLLVVVNQSNRSHSTIRGSRSFAVNLLDRQQQHLARHFASRPDDPFSSIAYTAGASGTPLLLDAMAVVECRVDKEVDHGSHTLFIGHVVSVSTGTGKPLVYHDGDYADVERMR